MFDLKKKLESADDDILTEIIEACEKKMVSPFAKKKVEVVSVEPDADEAPEKDDAEGEPEDAESKLADADLDELMEMYKSLKG